MPAGSRGRGFEQFAERFKVSTAVFVGRIWLLEFVVRDQRRSSLPFDIARRDVMVTHSKAIRKKCSFFFACNGLHSLVY